jgi:hypothetical protein
MARIVATLPAGSRITDYISLGVIAKYFPLEKVREALHQTNRASLRERDLPAPVVVYYVIALALYMRSSYREVLRCLLEGVQWLLDPSATVKVAGKSGISQARSRLGTEPLKKLYETVVTPIAEKRTPGAWMAAPWMWRTRRRTTEPSAGLGPAGDRVPTPRFVSWGCWKMARTFCGRRKWIPMGRMRSRWRKPWCPP